MILDLLGYGAFFLTTALTFGLICLGLNLQWGQTGLFNVGVAGFVAIGAYTSALLTTPATAERFGGFDMPVLVGCLAAAGVSGLAALVVGALTLRLRADYLAITTFGVAVSIQLVALNAQPITGGPFGVAFIPRPFASLQGNALAFNFANLLLVSAVILIVFVGLERLTRGPWGRVLRAIREDESAAAAIGKNANLYRLQAFGTRQRHHGAGGRLAGAFHRLHCARQLSFGDDLSDLGDADRRWGRQQSRRHARRRCGLGALEFFKCDCRCHLSARAASTRGITADRHDRRPACGHPGVQAARSPRRTDNGLSVCRPCRSYHP